jgi:hypothetical protein
VTWAGLEAQFTDAERAVLTSATVEDIMAPAGTLGISVPEALRAKFMAAVISRMDKNPSLDGLNIYTDPEAPR